jgi:uncharacterized protein (DUF302 family)
VTRTGQDPPDWMNCASCGTGYVGLAQTMMRKADEMTTDANAEQVQMNAKTTARRRGAAGPLIGGFVLGVVAMGLAVWFLMPGMMIVTHESALGFDETVAGLQAALEDEGWSSPGMINMNKSLAKHGQDLEPRVEVVQLCQPEYARTILTQERHVSCLMPCTISVWEGDDGQVYVSKMNTGLMGKMFGGVIAEIMGGKVSADEQAILSRVVAKN